MANRRQFLAGGGAAFASLGLVAPAIAQGAKPRVVVIGGGAGGAGGNAGAGAEGGAGGAGA